MIFDRQHMKDIRAQLDKASVLKQTPPQDVAKVPVVPWPKPEDLDFSGYV